MCFGISILSKVPSRPRPLASRIAGGQWLVPGLLAVIGKERSGFCVMTSPVTGRNLSHGLRCSCRWKRPPPPIGLKQRRRHARRFRSFAVTPRAVPSPASAPPRRARRSRPRGAPHGVLPTDRARRDRTFPSFRRIPLPRETSPAAPDRPALGRPRLRGWDRRGQLLHPSRSRSLCAATKSHRASCRDASRSPAYFARASRKAGRERPASIAARSAGVSLGGVLPVRSRPGSTERGLRAWESRSKRLTALRRDRWSRPRIRGSP